MNDWPKPNLKHDFVLLDLDRTLVDTDNLQQLFIETLVAEKIFALEEIEQLRNQAMANDLKFNVFNHLLQTNILDDSQASKNLQDQFVQLAADYQPGFLLEGAEKLLELLEKYGQFGIFTYGYDWWQKTKIKAVGLDNVPCLVTKNPKKGQAIAGWWQPTTSSYVLPIDFGQSKSFKVVGLIDDKASSFEALPSNCWGLTTDKSIVNSNVKLVADLNQVARELI